MTLPGAGQKTIQSRPRRAHIVLRDGEVLEGALYLNDGQSLAPYLGSRKGGWVNVVNAHWLAEGETHNHAVLQADHILMAASVDGDVPMYGSTSNPTLREVDIAIEDGTRVRGVLHLAEKQRLSDYLHACGKFLPVIGARRLPADAELGDIALNCLSIRVIRDAKVFAPGTMELSPDDPDVQRRTSAPAPVNREVLQHVAGPIELITEGRAPDRRAGRPSAPPPPPVTTPPLAVREPSSLELTAAQRDVADRLARHWLVQLAAGAQLSPPDPRVLPAQPTLEDVWNGLVARNDVSNGELAAQVAAAFKLPVANLDQVMPEALRSIPEKVARKLGVIPLRTDGKNLVLAVSDPSSMEIEQQLGFVTRLRLQFEIAPPADIRGAIDWHYGQSAPG